MLPIPIPVAEIHLPDCWLAGPLVAALQAYEDERREVTSRIVRTNRDKPPDYIIETVDLHRIADELAAVSNRYKDIAGYRLETDKSRSQL